MKYAILPGGFKPPHAGHYESAKYLAKETDADFVIVKVGSGTRDGITRSTSINVWNLYIKTDTDSAAKKIKVLASNNPAPVRDAYEFIEKEAPEGSTVYLGVGEKDASDNRWNKIPAAAKKANVKAKVVVIPPQAGGVSGTELRRLLKTGDKKNFFKVIPKHLSTDEKEVVWLELSSAVIHESKTFKTFSVDWWKKEFLGIITEGGAAGHMAHPFDLPNVKTGKDLIKVFEDSAESLAAVPGSVKIDGINASIRLVVLNGKQQFVLDRGSGKELDVKGMTKDDLLNRFGTGHGMVRIGSEVLDIFNESLPKIKPELDKLGFTQNPNLMFNMEYVSGKTNVQDYGNNFIAIHGVNEIKQIEGKKARRSSEVPYDKRAVESLLKKMETVAKKYGYEIYGSVPAKITKNPNFSSALNQSYTIEFTNKKERKTLKRWLDGVKEIPSASDVITVVDESGNTKKTAALSKYVYTSLLEGINIENFVPNINDQKKAIDGFVTYLATEKLGDEILKVTDSAMGPVENHEGVVIRDNKIAPVPFKITGKFIRSGLMSVFQK
jgi:hypothetical protein